MRNNLPWRKLIGQKCWHVSAGGSTMPSFVLVFGEKVSRHRILSNRVQPEIFRKFRGSIELLVWCSWRIQTNKTVLASSVQEKGGLQELLSLRGGIVADVKCYRPAWDLKVKFVDGRELSVFCDSVGSVEGISENWELWLPNRKIIAGPGTCIQVEHQPA